STATTATTAITGTGLYCIIRLTNSDQTYADFSAIGVTNSSLNLTGFKAGQALITPRRALAAVAGRPTTVARYVYALGGDSGADAAPIASVEAAPTDINGDLSAFAK